MKLIHNVMQEHVRWTSKQRLLIQSPPTIGLLQLQTLLHAITEAHSHLMTTPNTL